MSRGGHGAYALWLCATCGLVVFANHWAEHRRWCCRRTVCPKCRGKFPCRSMHCPEKEKPIVVAEEAPRGFRSLRMTVKKSGSRWVIRAPWLRDPVIADTWEDAYWLAVKGR